MFVTNQRGFGPTTIARIYKERWRMNVFVCRALWAWLNEPFTAPPPLVPEPIQGC